MGNIISGSSANTASSHKCDFEDRTMESKSALSESNKDFPEEEFHDTVSEDEERAKFKEEEMNEFKKELSLKREQRREILAKHKSDKLRLENALEEERKSKLELYEQNRHLRDILHRNDIEIPDNLPNYKDYSMFKDTLDQLTQDMENQRANNIKLRCDLASSHSALQAAFSEMADLSAQNTESLKQIKALKEVVAVSKTLISLREDQLTELKNKLTEIEQSLADREASMLSTDLRQEYERQLQNIRTLRGLYEERARLAEVTRQALVRELDDQKSLYQAETTRCTQLNSEVEKLKEKVTKLEEEIDVKNYEISACKEEFEVTNSEMLVVNKLFSQVILGYKSKKDLDQLVTRLEENHGILIHMAEQENGSEGSSALPKLLLELVNQVDDNSESETNQLSQANDKGEEVQEPNKAEEIVQNLPKVWKVLIELLSHQTESTTNEAEKVTTCYKSVETKSGPVLVPSVSQTYIRLKDLIIEKLSLIKEVNRMKQLNTHLETRLQEQEKRLCLVTTELSKTWHVVGRLRKHHHQLHTHEKILKYELQQKRKLLNELKEELEYCREKWEQAREKNTQTEQDWKKLRAEFSSRKLKDSTTFSHSAESGYSDERPSEESSESNDESEYIPESKLKSRNNKKSYETAVDSSVDLNLAEREDPMSDMIDVADLSLDTQDESHEIFDDSCNSEVLKSDKICDETEDEAVDICNDSSHEEFSTAESSSDLLNTDGIIKDEDKTSKYFEEVITSQGHSTQTPTSSDKNHAHLDEETQLKEEPENKYKEILKNIKQQDQRLHLKDKRLDELETNCTAVVTNISNTLNEGQAIAEKLDALHEKYSNKSPIISQDNNNEGTEAGASTSKLDNDLNSILGDIKKQDEYLAQKDERFVNLENGCSEVVANIETVVDNSDELLKQVNSVHEHYDTEDKVEDLSENKTQTEASTSNDHEARFAARDLRLKRLEEQTKSLVNKVNDTTTKGVKIHYKLEELHNIYGSEHSRSGTPSEETGETQTNDDEKGSENN
ncbi:unnamed protein product [Pieris brassicae]|uniref:Uncharacterized protein n=1 Tax=Pieris brassicae TaxID=7116 RepID=A0A9P0XIV3_PIEBR|nr:unnamed protein product [Pieris brassicae]